MSVTQSQKFLVVGGGSMGRRRIRCLLAHDIEPGQIRLVDTQEARRAEVKEKHGVDGLADLAEGLQWNPDAFLISVPGAYHMDEDVSEGVPAKNVPTGIPPSLNRVLRGGSYLTKLPLNLWIAYRHEDPPDLRHECIGFRVAEG